MADTVQRNESAVSFAWLSERVGPLARQRWDAIRKRMLLVDPSIGYVQDWVSDFWLARGSTFEIAMLIPNWAPPEGVDEWPTLGVDTLGNLPGTRTNHAAFVNLLQGNAESATSDHQQALDEFMRRESEIERRGDLRMVQGEHVRAWLGTALGRILMSVALTPQDSTAALIQETVERLAMPLRFELTGGRAVNAFEERRLDLLYNLRVSQDTTLVASEIRSGQGETWREHWVWLTREIGAAEAVDALQVAARLMRCVPLLSGLLLALQSDHEYLQTMALAVVRRSLLTLKVMTWLEAALPDTWKAVRPQDLECFAFNALKPEWPRRLLGISHRSADVKAALIKMRVWRSSRCGIDANYVPAWETNTGMMWGLFAAAPAIARIASPRYLESVWCRREFEITQYLVERGDYMEQRWVMDVEQPNLAVLDGLLTGDDAPTLLNTFPPLCQVWAPTPLPEWETKMLRAAAALRLMNVFLGNADMANRLAGMLAGGLELPGSAPTNNPTGWQAYAKIFAELRALTPGDSEQFPLRLPADYGEEERRKDTEWSLRIQDLSKGTPALADILVALEWYRVEWPAMLEQNRGDLFLIDCQRLTVEQWSTHEQVSLLRGLAGIRTTVPMWFLQLAGQEVENWPMVGERPIFTEHVSNQFAWLMAAWFERGEAQALYPAASGLQFSKELAAMCGSRGSAPA